MNIEQAISTISHEDAARRYEAACTLAAVDSADARRAVTALIPALDDGDSKVQYAVFSSLIKIADVSAVHPMVNVLIRRLDSQIWRLIKLNIGMRLRAGLLTIVQRGDDALSDLLYITLTTPDNTLDAAQQAFFIRLIGQTGDTRRIDMLIGLLDNADPAIQIAAAEALGIIGDVRAVAPLLVFLQGETDPQEDNALREASAEALGRIGDPAAFDPLVERLRDVNEWVRRAAVEALGRLGDKRAVEPLADALQDDSTMVQDAAFEALKSLSDGRMSVTL